MAFPLYLLSAIPKNSNGSMGGKISLAFGIVFVRHRRLWILLFGLAALGLRAVAQSEDSPYWNDAGSIQWQRGNNSSELSLGELRNLIPEARFWREDSASPDVGVSGFQARVDLGLGDTRRTSANFAPRLVPFGGPLSYSQGRDFSFTLDEPGESMDSPDLLGYYRIDLPLERNTMRAEGSFGDFGSHRAYFHATTSSETTTIDWEASYRELGDYRDGNGVRLSKSLDYDTPKFAYIPDTKDQSTYRISEVSADGRVVITPYHWLSFQTRYTEAQDVLFPELRMDAEYDRANSFSTTYHVFKPSASLENLSVRVFASIADQELNDRWRVSKFRSIPEATLQQYSTRAMSKSESIGLDFRAEKELPDSHMGFGLRWNWQYWDMLSETMNVNTRLIPLIDQTNLSTYIEGDKYFGNFEFSGAVRFDQFETEPKDSLALLRNYRPSAPFMIRENGLSSRGRLRYLLTDSTQLFMELGHSVRLPDPHELYLQYEQPQAPGNTLAWVGNPNLRSVKNTSLDLGYISRMQYFQVELKGFYSFINDLIYLEMLDPGSFEASPLGTIRSFSNIDARLYGADLLLGLDLSDSLRLQGSLAYLHGSKHRMDGYSGDDDLSEMPPIQGSVAVVFKGERWFGRAEIQVADSQLKVDQAIQEVSLEGYTIFNLVAACNLSQNTLWAVGVDNLGDQVYSIRNVNSRNPFSNFNVVNESGRFIYTSLRVSF